MGCDGENESLRRKGLREVVLDLLQRGSRFVFGQSIDSLGMDVE